MYVHDVEAKIYKAFSRFWNSRSIRTPNSRMLSINSLPKKRRPASSIGWQKKLHYSIVVWVIESKQNSRHHHWGGDFWRERTSPTETISGWWNIDDTQSFNEMILRVCTVEERIQTPPLKKNPPPALVGICSDGCRSTCQRGVLAARRQRWWLDFTVCFLLFLRLTFSWSIFKCENRKNELKGLARFRCQINKYSK